MNTTSVSLIDRLRQAPADGDAWQRLLEIYTPWLGAWLRAEGIQPSDADDVVQEVLAVLVRELPRFQHSGRAGAFRVWLRGIVVNRLREFRRSRGPVAASMDDLGSRLEQLADPHSEMSQRWDRDHDQNMVKRLLQIVAGDFEPGTWLAFRAFVLEGGTAAKVAVECGVSEGAVWTAKSRVLKRLRQAAKEILD